MNKSNILFAVIATIELLLIHSVSDLKPALGNWETKAFEIINLQIPSDNFYGPGSAIMLIPFLWNKPTFYLANLFYLFLGAYFYSLICNRISIRRLRIPAKLSLLLNPYIFWLADSSQDTVFEFFLLMLAMWSLAEAKLYLYAISGFVLSLSRSQYWLLVLAISILLSIRYFRKNRSISWKRLLPINFFIATILFNWNYYGSPSPALESGVTLEIAYSRYYYLGHPKFDIDYFLDGPSGPLVSSSPITPSNMDQAQSNEYFTKVAINEMLANPKQTALGFLQKLDSYIFVAQKVPSSNGYFKLNSKSNQISIENERLTWPLVLGNFLYFLIRGFTILIYLSSLIILFAYYVVLKKVPFFESRNFVFAMPWFSNLLVCVLIYTETRFKIVGEILIVPFSILVLESLIRLLSRFRKTDDSQIF